VDLVAFSRTSMEIVPLGGAQFAVTTLQIGGRRSVPSDRRNGLGSVLAGGAMEVNWSAPRWCRTVSGPRPTGAAGLDQHQVHDLRCVARWGELQLGHDGEPPGRAIGRGGGRTSLLQQRHRRSVPRPAVGLARGAEVGCGVL
jgi:hypothetical protein